MPRLRLSCEDVDNDAQWPANGDDELRRYLEDVARYPLLSKQDEIHLAQAVEAGDEAARRRLVEANLRVVVAVARRFDRSVVQFAEAIQVGVSGLSRAVDHYDWRKGFKFSAYATWWIRQAITDSLRGPGALGAP